jgi:PAS domain S-box-containing protein
MARRETTRPSQADLVALRRLAEERVAQTKARAASPRGGEDVQRLLHELEVHQIELEMQNEELRASRLEVELTVARYTELYDFAPIGYVQLARDGSVCSMNLAAASLLGIERRTAQGLPFILFFVDAAERAGFEDFVAQVIAGGESVCELTLTRGKAPRHVRITAATLPRRAPEELEILLALGDVTERKEREEEVKKALRVLTASQRAAKLGSFVMDVATGRWTSSAALDDILGIDARFKRTRAGWTALVHPDEREAMAVQLDAALREGDRIDREYRVVRRSDGEVRWVWILAAPEYDGTEPLRLVGTIQDVTERQRLLRERAELLRVAQDARARAEEASRAKDAFMAALSHELRNPLAPISNSLYLLEKAEPGSGQARRAAGVIGRQVRHLARIVDDLLDITRVTRGKIQLHRRRLDLSELARALAEDHASLFEGSGVRLELAPSPSPVVVDGDWDRLAQVVGNLLQNSAKFCPRGGVTRVAVSAERSEGRAVIRVADDGAGIAPDMLTRLFEPFTQAETTLDRSKGGLGLGTALAKGLVDLHGGEISAHSAGPGQGAEFVVSLPLAPEVAVPAREVRRPRAPRVRRRVLIIEDNVDAAESLRELLALHEHEITVAYDGPGGLARAREFHPEIVLCDIGLPGMDGYAVAAAFRSDEALRGVYLVALSGYALPEDLRRAVEAGFQRHVAKPPDIEDLERLFEEAPAAERGGGAAARP